MAARLIQRASRLLAVPVSFQPSFSSVPSECARLARLSSPFPCPASLHTSPLRHLNDSLPEFSQQSSAEGNKEFFFMLQTLSGVEELLEIATKHNVNGNKGVMVIQEIAKREIDDKEKIVNDERFQELLQNINNRLHLVWNNWLVRLMKSLYILGLDSNNRNFKSVVNETRWRIRRFGMGSLALLASSLTPMSQFKEKSVLLNDLVKQVELRWTEIKDSRTLVTLVSRLGFMSTTLMEKLEDKVLELAETFTPVESRNVIAALAAQSRRALPVLRALSFHLLQHKSEVSPLVTVDLLVCYAKLNFCHPQLVQKMTDDLIPKLPEIRAYDVGLLTQSLSTLRFSNQALLEAIAQTCLERRAGFSTTHFSFVVRGFAYLNFQPSRSEEFFSMIHQRLDSELDSLDCRMQLQLVRSLCILGQATTPYMEKILDPQFYRQILEENSQHSYRYYPMLMHVNTTAQLESPGYQGPLLPDDVLQTLQHRTEVTRHNAMHTELRDVLKMIFPEPGTCDYNVYTSYGWYLDGLLVLDSELKALALKDFVVHHDPHTGGTAPLPEGVRRFAIMSCNFSHYAFNTKEFLGRFAMSRRHLRAAGFIVVEVPYYDWQELKSDWQKQSFLKDKIKKAMAEEMAQ